MRAAQIGHHDEPGALRGGAKLCALLFICFVMFWPVIRLSGGSIHLYEPVLGLLTVMLAIAYPRTLWPTRQSRWLLILGVIWLLSQVLSDVIRGNSLENALRGAANILTFLSLQALIFAAIFGKERRLIIIALALGLGDVIKTAIAPNEYQIIDAWKFGYGTPLFIATLSAFCYFKVRRIFTLIMCLAFAILSIYLGTRSLALFIAATALLYAVPVTAGGRRAPRKRYLAMAVWSIVGIAALGGVYKFAVTAGVFSGDFQAKFESQLRGGLLLGGRSEMLGSIPAIIDSPIIGHGAWAENYKYAEMRAARLKDAGVDPSLYAVDALIPTHSHLLGAWVQAGIGGVLYWIAVACLTVRALFATSLYAGAYRPIVQFLLVSFLWAIVFSPLGLDSRATSALATSVVLYVISGRMLLKTQHKSEPA